MAVAYLGLGSNLGDKEANIRRAVDELDANPSIRVVRKSLLYLTAPVGYTDQPDFLNAVVEVETDLSPEELHHAARSIEREMGRVRNLRWGPRVIDIDMLIYDDLTVDTPDLTLPHPRMAERAFVMAPLAEIAPDLRLRGGRTAREISAELSDQQVCRLSEVP